MHGKITGLNGPIVTAGLPGISIGEQVRIGELGIIGEVIARERDQAVIQAYESTESLYPGERVESLGHPLSVELGPGLLGQIFDGIQRPLETLFSSHGDDLPRGVSLPGLARDRHWAFEPEASLASGDMLKPGMLLGSVPETDTIMHRILVPPDVRGELMELAPPGNYTVESVIAHVRNARGDIRELRLFHHWPVRRARPFVRRDHAIAPLLTGQRILDTFFPLLKGGKGAVPGPFGAGKTMVQQQIARWADADIVIYVGCGERGNELVDILESFPELTDPHTGRSLMERTLLIANTSNMPVVAREASIYVGVTLGEYYRDQGYDVVMVADSTSRWAEALREVGGRLGEMPVEEGYPAYLSSRLAAFYERAGRVEALGGRRGSVTLIGAVSPPGGDFSEPVTAHTKDIVETFWALSKPLADARHYPAVDWTDSFSGNAAIAAQWWAEEVSPEWAERRTQALTLLAQADELTRIVNLVGPEALSPAQRWALEGADLIKQGVLQQSALDPVDSYCPPQKQFALLQTMLNIYRSGSELLELGIPVQEILRLPLLTEARRLKNLPQKKGSEPIPAFEKKAEQAISALREDYLRDREVTT